MIYNNLKKIITSQCAQVISLLYPAIDVGTIEVAFVVDSKAVKFGDYQCNSCMKFSKILGQSALAIANNIVEYLRQINDKNQMFAKLTVTAPGFINFTLADQWMATTIESFLQTGDFFYNIPYSRSSSQQVVKKVIVDFSSPNIAKEMHVGHLRSTIVGDCIANMLSFAGHHVLRINHIGDWGTQFGMLIAYLKEHNKLVENFTVEQLVVYYKQAKTLFDNSISFKKSAQQEVVKLQQGDQASLLIWSKICNISAQSYKEIYKLLDINITDQGESFYNSRLHEVIKDFTDHNLVVESDGAKCIYLDQFIGRDDQLLPLIIQKADGGYNYATTDLAALKYRVHEEQADWLIYVTDNGQSLHFAMIFAAANKVGYLQHKYIKLNHVPLGLVLRADGKKFKTREGDTAKLIDLINTAITTAHALLVEKNTCLAEQELAHLAVIMGVNAIKYADLATNRNSDYMFDIDKMLKFTGNTAAFLSYAYVRINSINNNVGLSDEYLMQNAQIAITNSYERALAIRICKFPDVFTNAVEELLPNRITDYVYALAEEFHVFFHECRVVGDASQNNRLLLCRAVAKVMQICFQLLGLKLIEKM